MNIKEKTARISIIANVVLTFVKFIAYAYTGSLAILSEAWHSFSDIATSFLVWAAMKAEEKSGKRDPDTPKPLLSFEEKASIIIAFILFVVSITLFRSIFYLGPVKVTNPLFAGILFFIFGLSSYMVYKFETDVGNEQNSVGLTSDGLHSKSDMLSSFLTGGSLIAYHMGVDLDKAVSLVIAILIFTLSLEIFATIIWTRFYSDDEESLKGHVRLGFKTYNLLFVFFDSDILLKIDAFSSSKLGFKLSETRFYIHIINNGGKILLILITFFYLTTCAFSVSPGESALVERFGKLNLPALKPGLHFKLPWPFDRVNLINTQSRELQISNSADLSKALIWTRTHGDGQPFLSGDNNFIYPYFTLLYRVKDPVAFYNLHSNPEDVLKQICLKTVTDIFSRTPMSDMFAVKRKSIIQLIKVSLQKHLNQLNTGLFITNVCLKDIHPPISVAYAFESVVATVQEKQTIILQSYSYRNSEIPAARARAEKYINKASAYNFRQIYKAKGDSKRFELTENAFKETKAITGLRLYLDTMNKSLKQCKIVLVDEKVKQPSLFINTGKISPFSTDYGTGGQALVEESLPTNEYSDIPSSQLDNSSGEERVLYEEGLPTPNDP